MDDILFDCKILYKYFDKSVSDRVQMREQSVFKKRAFLNKIFIKNEKPDNFL